MWSKREAAGAIREEEEEEDDARQKEMEKRLMNGADSINLLEANKQFLRVADGWMVGWMDCKKLRCGHLRRLNGKTISQNTSKGMKKGRKESVLACLPTRTMMIGFNSPPSFTLSLPSAPSPHPPLVF